MKHMKKMMRGCEQMTQLMSESQERELTRSEQIALQMHKVICNGCRNFDKNNKMLSKIMKAHKQQ